MNSREKMLLVVVVLLVAGLGGQRLYSRFQRAVEGRETLVREAIIKLKETDLTVQQGRRALEQVEGWQRRSLPENREKALSLYKAWLLDKAKGAGLSVSDIKLAPRSMSSAKFDTISYQLTASGTLTNLTSMLYEFYKSPQLHQITKLQLSRPPGSQQMQVLLDVEALSLPGADATDSLPEGDSKRLKLASLAEYQKSLGDRELATVYTPLRPPSPPAVRRDPPTPPEFDDAEQAHFTGALNDGTKWQAWINVRTTGETLHVGAGDPVKVGALEAQIVSIEPKSLTLKVGDKTYRVPLGASLRSGKEIGAEPSAPSAASESPKS